MSTIERNRAAVSFCAIGKVAAAILWGVLVAGSVPAAETTIAYTTESLRGEVVWTADALKRLYGIEPDADSAHASVALEATDGGLHPIVKDARGRGFMLDERLRNRQMELLVRRYKGSPFVQVIRVYTLKDGKKYELDYWCDICAIAMYELKVCECCQGPIRIRERPVEPEQADAN